MLYDSESDNRVAIQLEREVDTVYENDDDDKLKHICQIQRNQWDQLIQSLGTQISFACNNGYYISINITYFLVYCRIAEIKRLTSPDILLSPT